jgi:RimJ/RimL family protein N-acetyltransferase
MWRSGDVVALRHLSGGRPSHVWPVIVVTDSPELTALYVQVGTPTLRRTRLDGTPLERALPYEERARVPWRLGPGSWSGSSCLQLQRAGEACAWWRWLDGSGWYVNLQEPLRRTAIGFDTTDHVLDLVVSRDGCWSWKDEDELDAACRLGRFTQAEAAEIRRWGESAARAVEAAAWPLDSSWADWQPDPAWPLPELQPGWDEPMPPALRTERLELRPLGDEDLAWYAELRARDGFDGAAAAARHAEALEHWAVHGFGKFAVHLDGEPAALITLNHAGEGLEGIEANEVDLGWYTLPHLWGRGIAPEAAGAVIEWARANGIGPLVVYLRTGNAASRRVAEKLGLRRDADGRASDAERVEIYRLPSARDVSGL